MIDFEAIVGTHDLALITLDTLRYDVAVEEMAAGRTPNLAALIPSGWEPRHSPGTFTYAAHAAFFAGFLPTPMRPGRHPRPFALRFEGSETIGRGTCVLDGASIVEGLAARGYHTLCVGGTGFFNLQNPLGRVLPSLFAEHHWRRELGVTEPRSFEHQIDVVEQAHARLPAGRRAFTFINVSALHQPNHFYLDGGAARDSRASHAAALRYIDAHVPRLFDMLGRRAPLFAIACSDHGTLYGEDGYVGHRVAHPIVTTVPYAEILLMTLDLEATRYQAYVYAYPHKTAYRPIDPPVPLAPLWAGERRDSLFLYLHVPFCEQRCGFCNLFTRPVPPEQLVDAYLATLARQTAVVRRALDEGGRFAFARAAIGGGTPTLLDAHQLERVIAMIRSVGAPQGIPMSIETSPETALPDRLAVVVGGGADRISIGVQSFVEAECRAVNRPQQPAEVHRALRAIRDARPATLNIDVMYGLPGQTEATWQSTLANALEYRPEEIYLYPLYVRPLTTLGKRGAANVDATRVALYDSGRARLLDAGYRQVSLRMFRLDPASPGPVYCCQDDGMVGLGCGARSYTRSLHYSSEWAVGARGVRDIIDDWVQRSDADFAAADYGFVLDDDEQRRRWLILSLLSDDGLDLAAYRERFGADADTHFPELAELAPRGLATHAATKLTLTPEGLARADAIGPWLFSGAVRTAMAEYALR